MTQSFRSTAFSGGKIFRRFPVGKDRTAGRQIKWDTVALNSWAKVMKTKGALPKEVAHFFARRQAQPDEF